MNITHERIHLYVWDERFLYIGPSISTSLHRNHASVWLLAEQGQISVTLGDGREFENEVVYIPSEIAHSTREGPSLIAALCWEPESASFKRIVERFDNQPRAFPCRYAENKSLRRLLDDDTPLDEADALITRLFGLEHLDPQRPAFVDARITTTLQFLRDSPEAYAGIHDLASRVHLSASRFAHLFKAIVGVPVRRYVLWMKMRRALDLAITGESLTSAAMSAGFADSAHLSRSVRALLGFAPEFLFRHRERLVIHR